MKKKLIVFFIAFFSLFDISCWQYDKQKDTFYYTIDFPDQAENWFLINDARGYNAFFQSESRYGFVEVTVYDINSAENNQALFDFIVDKYKMKGTSYSTIFCQYDAIRGEYEFKFNTSPLTMDIVVFKDGYYFYVVMGYCYNKKYDEYKGALSEIIDSFKIYYDNGIIYENTGKNKFQPVSKSKNERENTIDEDGETYKFSIKWDTLKKDFEFLKSDLDKGKKEISEIGEYNGNVWKGWGYFNIDTGKDPDYNFTFWKKFYQEMYNTNYYRVNYVYDFFKKLASSGKYTTYKLAETILHFIQKIPYERPANITKKGTGENILDYFIPNEVASYGKGDCDTKSLFLVIILRRLGYDALMFHSAHYGHAMAGLNINASGIYKTYNGKKYYFVETTYPGWKIGDMPPEMNDVSKWRVVPIM